MEELSTDLARLGQVVRDPNILANLIASVTLIIALIILKILLVRGMTQWSVSDHEQRRRWIVNVKNILVLFGAIGLVHIWSDELKTFALSVVAVAAAIVIATKELLMCCLGGVFKAVSRPFSVGDRIEVGNHKGNVIDHSFLTTTLSEVGPDKNMHQYTGRTLVLPNSLYLTTPIINETVMGKYVLHIFRIPVCMSSDWESAEKVVLHAARSECGKYLKEAQNHLNHLGKAQGLEPPSAEPRVTLHLPDTEKLELIVRIPVPEHERNSTQQAILRRYLRHLKERTSAGTEKKEASV